MERKKIIILSTLLMLLIAVNELSAQVKFFDGTWEEAKKEAKKKKAPIMLDFYTSWCGYCKKLDRYTFRDSAVTEVMDNHFIANTNNGDDWDSLKFPLPEGEWFIYSKNGGMVTLIKNKSHG